MVQFGIFDHIEGMPGTEMGQLYRDRLDLIKMADQAGFHAYHLAEHHGTDLCMAPSQEIFLAAAAQVTSTIRLGPLVKILPLHHPLQVIEEICMLDQLSDGRVEYGVGRGIAAIEHFWFQGDWFEARERFDEALALILRGLRTGVTGGAGGKHYDFPEIELSLRPVQVPNPPIWYPGNPVVAGRYGFGLVWPGVIPQEAYDLYVSTWDEYKDDPVRADVPGARPRVGATLLIGIGDDDAEGKAIAARGFRGLMRRIVEVHVLDRLALDEREAEAALNPLARGAQALMAPGGEEALMPMLTADSGTASHVTERLQELLATGQTDYIILQLPTGDMTYRESRATLETFIDKVAPALVS
jgi:alkanesulfonate monooxygenase SsuD/methylene tetrahydromethanopterin reductase-like flavin-dependent oxidoreductase (luciferase family)